MATLSDKIVLFAKQNLGKRVFASVDNAKGECWDLAFAALENAGAKTPHDYGSIYKWSSQKVTVAQAKPGDILQYKNYKVEVKTTKADGSWTSMTFTIGSPRHTAIIKEIAAHGVTKVYEQNVGGVRTTAENDTYLKPGTYQHGGKTIKVTKLGGSFIIYRPKPKP